LNAALGNSRPPITAGRAQVKVARGEISAKLRRVLNPFIHWIEAKGVIAPWLFMALFLVASFLMIWRLEAMGARGFEGTVLGTLVMPYCSGIGNLIYAYDYGRLHYDGGDVMINSLVNNVSNMTLILGVPAILWGINVIPKKKATAGKKKAKATGNTQELNRLSLLLTLMAVLFFTGAVWAMGRKGRLDFNDGLVLVGLFLFWQCFHVFEVLKQNERQGKSAFGWMLPVDLALLAVGAYGIYVSTDWFVHWAHNTIQHGFVHDHPGWVSGWLMALPNGMLAFYYGWYKQPEVVYTSQVGDAHVSIPLCLGVYALFQPMTMPVFFHAGMLLLLGATLVHLFCVAVFGRLPRLVGVALVGAYGYFLWKGLLG
jgi:cation:H+ antiporter